MNKNKHLSLEEVQTKSDELFTDLSYSKHFEGPLQQIECYENLLTYELEQGFISNALENTIEPLFALYFKTGLSYREYKVLDQIFKAIRRERKYCKAAAEGSQNYYALARLYYRLHNLNKAEECLILAYKSLDMEKKYQNENPQRLRQKIIASIYSINKDKEKNLDALFFGGKRLSEEKIKEKERIIEDGKKFSCSFKFDPIEWTSVYQNAMIFVSKTVSEKLGPEQEMGKCFSIWSMESKMLARRDIDWITPPLMNPGTMFD